MEHPVALDHLVGILQQVLGVDQAEVALAGPEHHRDDVHPYLVDQARGERLAAYVASGNLDHAVTRKLLRRATAALMPSTKWKGASGCQPSGLPRWVTTTT